MDNSYRGIKAKYTLTDTHSVKVYNCFINMQKLVQCINKDTCNHTHILKYLNDNKCDKLNVRG
jgi:hypothetical protein